MWQHITEIFYQDIENELKLLSKLTYEDVNLNAYSVMRVNLAAHVLSATATAKLCEMVDRLFDCLNVRSMTKCERKP